MHKGWVFGLIAVLAVAAGVSSADAQKLNRVQAKGFIQCGVNGVLPGFSVPDEKGNYSGLDVDYCRALAAAVLGDASKLKFTPLTANERFSALQSGEIDVLSRNTTWTMDRDVGLGMNFAGVIYYDGQGIMVNKSLGATSAKDLDGATICVAQGTTTELNLDDFFTLNNIAYTPVKREKTEEVVAAYANGECTAYTADRSGLAAQRITLKAPADHVILPDVLSKEPLGPAVQQGDEQWLEIAKWTLYALINAEELGITQANVDDMKANSKDADVRRFLGVEGAFGPKLGLSQDWAYNIIKAVGNYGEIYDRNIGPRTAIGLDRGVNALWKDKGIQYAPPIR